MSGGNIRKTTKKLVEGAVECYRDSWNSCFASHPLLEPYRQHVDAEIRDGGCKEDLEEGLGDKFDVKVHVYVDGDGKVKGFIRFYFDADGNSVYVSHLFVHPDCQHKGIGLRLLNKAEDYCASINVKKLWLHCLQNNERAGAFYAHQGFVLTDKETLGPECGSVIANVLAKTLDLSAKRRKVHSLE